MTPAALGFDPQRLAAIGPAMRAFVDDGRLPNLVTLVARRGQVVHQHACGVLDLDDDTPAGLDTLFRMWSNTKPIAGVATLILYERGKLNLDDPVARFLPEYAEQRVRRADEPMATEPAKRGITIRDCLTNTAGLQDPSTMPNSYREQYEDILTKIGWVGPARRHAQRARERQPGASSCTGAGCRCWRIRASASSTTCGLSPCSAPCSRRQAASDWTNSSSTPFSTPLRMDDTGFYLKDGALPRFGACYVPREVGWRDAARRHRKGGKLRENRRTETGSSRPGAISAGVLTTVGDYARFGQMLLNGGELDGVRVLGRKTAALVAGNHTGEMVIPITGPGYHWGLGVSVYHGGADTPPIHSVGTYGWDRCRRARCTSPILRKTLSVSA